MISNIDNRDNERNYFVITKRNATSDRYSEKPNEASMHWLKMLFSITPKNEYQWYSISDIQMNISDARKARCGDIIFISPHRALKNTEIAFQFPALLLHPTFMQSMFFFSWLQVRIDTVLFVSPSASPLPPRCLVTRITIFLSLTQASCLI